MVAFEFNNLMTNLFFKLLFQSYFFFYFVINFSHAARMIAMF